MVSWKASVSEAGTFRSQEKRLGALKQESTESRTLKNLMGFAPGGKTETVIKTNLGKRPDGAWCWWMSYKVVGGTEGWRQCAQG